jgi:hypothetical protein
MNENAGRYQSSLDLHLVISRAAAPSSPMALVASPKLVRPQQPSIANLGDDDDDDDDEEEEEAEAEAACSRASASVCAPTAVMPLPASSSRRRLLSHSGGGAMRSAFVS